jgi:hypothetical protein
MQNKRLQQNDPVKPDTLIEKYLILSYKESFANVLNYQQRYLTLSPLAGQSVEY